MKNEKLKDMGRKFFNLFTFLLLGLFHVTTVYAEKVNFPFAGGATSDGVTIANVKLVGFNRVEGHNCVQVIEGKKKATMTFTVTVPAGQSAQLSYKLLLDIDGDEELLEDCKVSFKATVDGKENVYENQQTRIYRPNDRFSIPQGTHTVALDASFDADRNCSVAGSIDNLCVHIHQYGNEKLANELLCGEKSQKKLKCDICKKDTVLTVNPKFAAHQFSTIPASQSSCLDNKGQVRKCENCPYTEIKSATLQEHQFGSDGTCTVCGLHRPKSRDNGTIYEINNAGEMRVLAELVSIGKIPSNVGVDILSDLVFDKVSMLPLGTANHPFSGVLNGNGHRISGITSCIQGIDCLGFVGVAKGTIDSRAVIANLIFDGGNNLKGTACVGGIVGAAAYCNILNCASFGTLEGSDYVGGILGFADQQVNITNCAAVTTIRTEGRWNPIACGMPSGMILNSYSVVTNEPAGSFDPLKTATQRHTFSSHGTASGLTRITREILWSSNMEQALSEESEVTAFKMSEKDTYPIPYVNTSIVAKSNGEVETPKNSLSRRAGSSGDDAEQKEETIVIRGYVDETLSANLGKTVDQIMREDYLQNEELNYVYIIGRQVPEGTKLYEPVSGGELVTFESYSAPDDSTYIRMRQYDLVAPERVLPVTETINASSGNNESIEEYRIEDGVYTLISRLSFENKFSIVYQENVNGALQTIWTIDTQYDYAGTPTVSNAFSYNATTGEKRLEYSYSYTDEDADDTDDNYEEYLDSETNTIHVIYNYLDTITGVITHRDHYIIRASDQYIQEMRVEKMVGGQPVLTDGLYFIYDEDDAIVQMVSFGPVDPDNPDSEVLPYRYEEYIGRKLGTPFPTAIEIPTANRPSLQKHADPNVYDMQGRVVRRVTDMKDPFCGLPRGLYLYQGAKYLKK